MLCVIGILSESEPMAVNPVKAASAALILFFVSVSASADGCTDRPITVPSVDESTIQHPVDRLTSVQKARAEMLTSLFENGTPVTQYAFAQDIGDGRGITAGRAGFTTGTGDLL